MSTLSYSSACIEVRTWTLHEARQIRGKKGGRFITAGNVFPLQVLCNFFNFLKPHSLSSHAGWPRLEVFLTELENCSIANYWTCLSVLLLKMQELVQAFILAVKILLRNCTSHSKGSGFKYQLYSRFQFPANVWTSGHPHGRPWLNFQLPFSATGKLLSLWECVEWTSRSESPLSFALFFFPPCLYVPLK